MTTNLPDPGVPASHSDSLRGEDAKAPRTPASVAIEDWGWRHGGRLKWTLDGVNLQINPGERVLVLGPSGSGKSTLMAGLAGLLGGEDEGEARGSLLVDGEKPENLRGRIGLMMQDPEAQVVLARVGDDVAFGMENLGVPREEMWPRVDAALEAVGLNVSRDRNTSMLSGGQKQRLALASILAMQPGLLLLDEPTANLDPEGVAGVRDAVERVLAVSGATMVVIEHRVDVWASLVDRVIVILDGVVAADGPIGQVLAEQGEMLKQRGIWLPGDDVVAALGASEGENQALDNGGQTDSTPILSVRDLTIGYSPEHPVRTGISLDIPRGQSTCLVGANGAGKTTLALTLAGLLPQIEGTISAAPKDGLPSESADPHEWRSKDLLGRISMVFQEPEYQFVSTTVRGELEIGPRQEGIDGDELADLVDEHLAALGLTALADANPMTLSGGEKRRLSVASALISAPELLILDEPTFGQDRTTWLELVRLLRRAQALGTTLVSITHDPAFVEAMGQNVIDLGSVGVAPAGANSSLAPTIPTDEAGHASSDATLEEKAEHSATEPTRPKRFIELVNPVTQVLSLILMTTPLILSIDVISAGIALVLELLLLPVTHIRARTIAFRMIPLFLAAPLAALSMLLYANPAGEIFWSFGPATISERSVWMAAGIFLRVLAIGMPAIVLLSRIDPTDMADGLAQILHVPARPVLATLAAARMTGLMTADWKGLEQARRIRGIGDAHKVVSLARGSFSLLVFALRRSAKLSLTMEARGFGATGPRTWARQSSMGVRDIIMLIVSILVPIIALSAAVYFGYFALIGR